MMFLQCEFKSEALGKVCSFNLLLPSKPKTNFGRNYGRVYRPEYPVLYLLHGLGDNHWAWMRRTSIERYIEQYDTAVVMPDGERSFYTDMKNGGRFWSMLADELPEVIAANFPVSQKREMTFAAGLSMGGYGAFKLGLSHPERFAAVGGISSVTNIPRLLTDGGVGSKVEMVNIFGSAEQAIADGNDLFTLAAAVTGRADAPRLMQICGTEDFLYADNKKFRDHLRKINYPNYEYFEEPGIHEWGFWDRNIQKILAFMHLHR